MWGPDMKCAIVHQAGPAFDPESSGSVFSCASRETDSKTTSFYFCGVGESPKQGTPKSCDSTLEAIQQCLLWLGPPSPDFDRGNKGRDLEKLRAPPSGCSKRSQSKSVFLPAHIPPSPCWKLDVSATGTQGMQPADSQI